MDDIHSPSVAGARATRSVPSSAPTGSSSSTEALFELMKEKDRVEAELKALGSVLDSVELLCRQLLLLTCRPYSDKFDVVPSMASI
jgi:hypothetical protein